MKIIIKNAPNGIFNEISTDSLLTFLKEKLAMETASYWLIPTPAEEGKSTFPLVYKHSPEADLENLMDISFIGADELTSGSEIVPESDESDEDKPVGMISVAESTVTIIFDNTRWPRVWAFWSRFSNCFSPDEIDFEGEEIHFDFAKNLSTNNAEALLKNTEYYIKNPHVITAWIDSYQTNTETLVEELHLIKTSKHEAMQKLQNTIKNYHYSLANAIFKNEELYIAKMDFYRQAVNDLSFEQMRELIKIDFFLEETQEVYALIQNKNVSEKLVRSSKAFKDYEETIIAVLKNAFSKEPKVLKEIEKIKAELQQAQTDFFSALMRHEKLLETFKEPDVSINNKFFWMYAFAYAMNYDFYEPQWDNKKRLIFGLLLIWRGLKAVTEFPLLGLSLLCYRGFSYCERSPYSLLRIPQALFYALHVVFDVGFFIARATLSPFSNQEEMRKKGSFWSALSVATSLISWTAITVATLGLASSVLVPIACAILPAPVITLFDDELGVIGEQSQPVNAVFPQEKLVERVTLGSEIMLGLGAIGKGMMWMGSQLRTLCFGQAPEKTSKVVMDRSRTPSLPNFDFSTGAGYGEILSGLPETTENVLERSASPQIFKAQQEVTGSNYTPPFLGVDSPLLQRKGSGEIYPEVLPANSQEKSMSLA